MWEDSKNYSSQRGHFVGSLGPQRDNKTVDTSGSRNNKALVQTTVEEIRYTNQFQQGHEFQKDKLFGYGNQ
jgi:hypothetical protein